MTPFRQRNGYASGVKGRPGKAPLLGRDRAIEIARRIDLRRRELQIIVEELLPLLGLKSKSAWTKRTNPAKSDWVAFQVDEIESLVPRLGRSEPGWPYLNETEARILRRQLEMAEGAQRPPESATPPITASTATAEPPRRLTHRSGAARRSGR